MRKLIFSDFKKQSISKYIPNAKRTIGADLFGVILGMTECIFYKWKDTNTFGVQ